MLYSGDIILFALALAQFCILKNVAQWMASLSQDITTISCPTNSQEQDDNKQLISKISAGVSVFVACPQEKILIFIKLS